MKSKSQITHDNHFVPQFYLKQWSDDGKKIWAYRILVSHPNVSEWTYRSIDRVANLRDLYTALEDGEDGEDIDNFEKWLESIFENPVTTSLRKVLKDNPLKKDDWENLAMFLGAQDVRTPLSYLESAERWQRILPKILKEQLEEVVRGFEENTCNSLKDKPSTVDHHLLENILSIQTISTKESNSNQAYIKASIVAGKRLWLHTQKLLLTKTVETLKNHKWSIVHPARGYKWFTTDHPVVKLNYYHNGDHDLKGGWGLKGGNIFMPLSPRHLLFTEIGRDMPDRMTFPAARTKQIQSFIAERALRWIFAHDRLEFINKLKPRIVNPELFNQENDQWSNWHEKQLNAESSKQ